MNNEKIEVSAKSVDAAVKKGLEKLGLEKDQAEWEVLQEAGFLRHCKISIGKKPTQASLVREYAEKMLDLMGFDYAVEATETDSEILLELTGVNAGDIIGRRGDVLDAFQYMLNVLTKNFDDDFKRVTVDTENYRAKRAEALVKLARNLEKKVKRTARPVRLEYMNPFERRAIHTALQDSLFVDTVSEGEEPRRFVVIKPKAGLKPRPDSGERRGSGRGGDKKDRRGKGTDNGARRRYDDTEDGDSRSAVKPDFEEEKKEPTYDGGVMKKLNFVYRSEKKRRRLK